MAEHTRRDITEWVDATEAVIDRVRRAIWEYAEVAKHETRSASCLKEALAEAGFKVYPGAAAEVLPTSFVAEYGSGRPVIGLLAEYDALSGLSQDSVPFIKESPYSAESGHGCGHCVLGAGILGAALALKHVMEAENIGGTIRFYGCPAEETIEGKVIMSSFHMFDDCDAALSWHPNDVSYVWARKSLSLKSLKYRFYGKTAHAGLDPWNGRSAADAVELMNVGSNYLREHIPQSWRVQYVTTEAGRVPNIVPDRAAVWYNLRTPDHLQGDELHSRVRDIAAGAALMTGTRMEEEFIAGCYDFHANLTFADRILRYMKYVGAPAWTKEDHEFAAELFKQMDSRHIDDSVRSFSLGPSDHEDGLLNTVYGGYYDRNGAMGASTDVGDVSWQIPVGCFSGAAVLLGSPGHSWFYTAACGTGIGTRGAVAAAKVLALTGYDLFTDPQFLDRIKEEHAASLKGLKYVNPFGTKV